MLKQQEPDASTVDLTAALAVAQRQRNLSRRSQALLASAGLEAPDRHWFVLTVAPSADAAVGERLAVGNVECWLPHVMITPRKHRGRKGPTPAPYPKLALPGYVFVCVPAEGRAWAALAGVKGVTGILGSAGRPIRVGPQEMRKLRDFVGANAAADIVLDTPKSGDAVRVKAGAFVDRSGRVGRIDERGFAVVEILIFGRVTPVSLDLAQLSKL